MATETVALVGQFMFWTWIIITTLTSLVNWILTNFTKILRQRVNCFLRLPLDWVQQQHSRDEWKWHIHRQPTLLSWPWVYSTKYFSTRIYRLVEAYFRSGRHSPGLHTAGRSRVYVPEKGREQKMATEGLQCLGDQLVPVSYTGTGPRRKELSERKADVFFCMFIFWHGPHWFDFLITFAFFASWLKQRGRNLLWKPHKNSKGKSVR